MSLDLLSATAQVESHVGQGTLFTVTFPSVSPRDG
jgi:signal transduction histidine kinase